MSSFLCFLCHSTVNADTNEDMREKYRDVVGMNLCPDSHLCYICCHVLNKLSLFKTVCLKRSLEYPVLFSEKGTLNLQRTDLEVHTCCPDDMCGQYHNRNFNSSCQFLFTNFSEYESHQDYINKYVELAERTDFDDYFNININEIIAKEPVVFVSKSVQTDNVDIFNEKDTVGLESKGIQTDSLSADFVDDANDSDVSNSILNDDYNNGCHDQVNNFSNFNQIDVNIAINDYQEDYYDNNIASEDEMKYDENTDNDETIKETLASDDEINKNENEDENHITKETNFEEIKEDFIDTPKLEDNIRSEAQIEISKKKKKKKVKQKFKKIVFTLEEQKAELERKRKEKKYIEAEFKCYNCALGFLFKDTYQAHMMRHEESNGEYVCPTCTVRFASQPVLLGHIATHNTVYVCLNCGESVRKRARNKHEKQCWHCGEIDQTEVTCHLCGRMYGDANALQQHLKRYHEWKTSSRTHSCSVCGKRYGNLAAVRTHMITHLNRKFDCDQCGSTFSSPYTLRQHKRTHWLKAGAHPCECGALLGSRKSLLAHRRLHHTASLSCPACPRQCPSARALSLHISRVHSAPTVKKPQPPPPIAICHLCGASFKGNSKLNRHLKKSCKRAKIEEDDYVQLYEQQCLANT